MKNVRLMFKSVIVPERHMWNCQEPSQETILALNYNINKETIRFVSGGRSVVILKLQRCSPAQKQHCTAGEPQGLVVEL